MKAGAKKALKAASWKLAEVNQKILLPGSADCQPKCGLIFIWASLGKEELSPGLCSEGRRSNSSRAIVLRLASDENNETTAAGNVLRDLFYDSTVSSAG